MPRRENPLGSAEDALTRFAADLRALREQAGMPTYRQLSARAHYSAAALSEAAGGRKLPSLSVTLAYVRACDGDTAVWEQRWRELSATQAREPAEPAAGPDETPPYAGFAAIEDPALFAGRADLVDELTARVRERRLTAVVGASGSGKTSLLRAGLLPALTSHLTDHVVMTPGPNPLEECAIRLADVVGAAPGDLYRELAEAPENLHLRVRQACADRPEDLVLVVDQFEEALTGEHDHFVAALVHAATATTSRVRVVLGVRAGHADRLPAAARDGQVHVGPMTADGLREAITEPASGEGCRVETALLVRLIADTGGPGTLPFLQQALLGMWRRRRGTTLSIASYEAMGDIPRLIADAAERVFTALDADGQRIARNLVTRLASSAGGLRRDDLDADTAAVLDELVLARVVVADADHLRLAGRSLRERWPRLRDWLAEDGDRLRMHRELAEAAATWESLDRDPGALFRGVRLDTARTWLATGAAVITARERDFLRASESARTGERRRARRVRAGLAALSVLVVLATGAVVYAVRADRSADRQRAAAAAQSALREAAELLETDPALAMQLTIAAHRLDPTAPSRDAVLALFADPYAARITAHTGTVYAVAVSGDVLATAGDDATWLWDIGDPVRPRELAVLEGSATSVAFSADGRVAVTGTPAGAQLWDLTEPTRPRVIPPVGADNLPERSPAHVALSGDGRTLALSKENDVRLYDVTVDGRPRRIGTLSGGTEPVTSVAFSPDGKTVLTTSADNAARLWTVADRTPTLLTRGNLPMHAAVFSQDGRFVATAGEDGMVRRWRVADRAQVDPLVLSSGAVRDVTFSQDGGLLAATGDDRATTVWDVTGPRPVRLVTLSGHADAGTGVRFTADGRTLVTSSRDRTVRLVDLAEVLAGRTGSDALAWDGTVLASGGDGTVRLFDVRDRHAPRAVWTESGTGPALAAGVLATGDRLWDVAGQEPARMRADVGDATGSALSRDGKLLVTTYAGGRPKLWSVADPGTPLADLPAEAARVAVFGDGLVATLGNEIILWDIADPAHPKPTVLPPQLWTGLALRPDGRVLAAMASDGTGWLWDVADPSAPKKLGTFTAGPTTAVAFAPNGRTLVTATGATATLWDVSAPRRPSELATLRSEHGRPVTAVVFSPDGRSFAAASEDGTLKIWDVTVAQVERRVCAVVSPRLDEEVWARYLPDVPYRPVCP
ncbi:MAG: hypothetical protein WBA97_04755 [Actinophytocola sp.]|uniref:nSTAND1 domain-containing NTPase n=1 Tax=Actinophytocola sp. TaxID=1872138 RepID=UPI003C789F70